MGQRRTPRPRRSAPWSQHSSWFGDALAVGDAAGGQVGGEMPGGTVSAELGAVVRTVGNTTGDGGRRPAAGELVGSVRGQSQREGGPGARVAPQLHLAAVVGGDMFDDGQAEPGTTG